MGVSALALLLAVACSEGDDHADAGAASPDAQMDGLVVPGLTPDYEPIAPAPPAPPVMTPCPEGFYEVPGDPVVCSPWPETGMATCAQGLAHFPGEPGCRPLGSPCPAGDFPDDLPATSVVYVRPVEGGSGGDGTREQPFARLTDAIAVATAGTTIALARGAHVGPALVPEGVVLRGACAAETRISTDVADPRAGVIELAPGATLRDVTVSGPRPGVAAYTAGATAHVESVAIEDAEVIGLLVKAAAVSARDVLVRRTRPEPATMQAGVGVYVGGGGQLVLERAVVAENRDVGVQVIQPGTSLEMRRVAVLDTAGRASDGEKGMGIAALGAASLVIEASTIERSQGWGMAVSGVPLTVADSRVVDTRGRAVDSLWGRGIDVVDGAPVTLTRVLLSGNREIALVGEGGATIEATDLVVLDTREETGTNNFGIGVGVHSGGVATIRRARIDGAYTAGMMIFDEGALGSQLDAEDVVIRRVRPSPADGQIGAGVSAGGASSLTLRRIDVAEVHSAGVLIGQMPATIEDARVADVESDAAGDFGRGVSVQEGASVVLRRVDIARVREVGAIAMGAGASVEAEDLRIAEVRESTCAATTCAGSGSGDGLSALQGAHVTARQFVVTDCVRIGVQIASDGAMDLFHGVVRRNVIGANVQTVGFDLSRISREVLYVDNEVTLDSTALPVPDRPIGGAGF